jgi:hypothetical protein
MDTIKLTNVVTLEGRQSVSTGKQTNVEVVVVMFIQVLSIPYFICHVYV